LPFPKTWTEELILEWLQLKGYLALSNVRLKSGKRGGVEEADIIGLRLRRKLNPESKTMVEVLEVLHIEVGSLAMRFEKALKSVLEKFAQEREEAIKSLAVDVVELESVYGKAVYGLSRYDVSRIEYKRVFVASEVAKGQVGRLKEELSKYGIEFKTLGEVVREVMHDVDEWKRRQMEKGFRTTKRITLPESLWLLNLIDYMKKEGLVTEGP
jgi:Zn-finger domain-containing protein